MKYRNIFRDTDGTEVEIKIKTKCTTPEKVSRTLSFVAKSSRQFYLKLAERLADLSRRDGMKEVREHGRTTCEGYCKKNSLNLGGE